MIKYINAIRNQEKKAYAILYAQYVVNGEVGDEPGYDKTKLSYMAAQAVRMSLFQLHRAC